jgi:hypothetical protein
MASSLGPIGSDLGGERTSVASALPREPDRRCRFAPARGRGVATFSRLEEQYRRNGVDIKKGFGVVVIGTATCRLLSRSCGATFTERSPPQTISGRGREGNREGMSGGEPRLVTNRLPNCRRQGRWHNRDGPSAREHLASGAIRTTKQRWVC